MSLRKILAERQFGALFWTQFAGALNGNFLQNALAVSIAYQGIKLSGFETKWLVALVGSLFLLPFFLFSPLAGQIADKFEKSRLVRYVKIWEFVIISVGIMGFLTESYMLLLFVLFCLGLQSTFFGPLKYSIIPQIVESKKLVEGNAYVELGTFLAIFFGTVVGGYIVGKSYFEAVIFIVFCWVSIFGIWMSLRLRPIPAGDPSLKIHWNPVNSFMESWRLLRENKAVYNSVLGISWFWFFSAGVISVVPLYCRDYLGTDDEVVIAFLAVFTLGIGLGSVLCEMLSFKKVEIGLVPLGSIGMTIFLFDVFWISPKWTAPPKFTDFISHIEGVRLLFDFFFMAVFGGFFNVPLYSLIQQRSRPEIRSRIIAGNNVINSVFMVLSSALVIWFYWFNLSLPEIFLILAIVNLLAAIYMYTFVPEFTLRLVSWGFVHLLYRLHIRGYENIPETGPVVLACNHISYVDWLVIMGAVGRPTRFIIYYKYYDVPVGKQLMKQAKVIRIAGRSEDASVLDSAYETVSQALNKGEVVCIFPEGQITYDGNLQPFKAGIAKIVAKNPAPVVPMALNGLFLSMFSRRYGYAFWKLPRKLWKPIYLDIGKPIPPEEFSLELLEQRIRELLDPSHDRD